MALQAQRLSFSFQFQLEFIWEFASRKFFNKRFLYFCRKNLLNLKEFAYFAVNAPLSICQQFIDKKKTMVTHGNFFLSDTAMHKYIQSWIYY